MIRAIISDLDGTLFQKNSRISEESQRAIKAAAERGIRFCIATGRSWQNLKSIWKETPIACSYILDNGAEVRRENGELVSSISIPIEKVRRVYEILKARHMTVEFYTEAGDFITQERKNTTSYVLKEPVEEFLNKGISVRKLLCFSKDVELIEELKKEIAGLGGLSVLSSFVDNIEVTAWEAQKGFTLEQVAEQWGFSKEEVAVFGDSFNDYTMFERFPNSYAPENAVPMIRQMAKEVIPPNEEDGVAKKIWEILKEDLIKR